MAPSTMLETASTSRLTPEQEHEKLLAKNQHLSELFCNVWYGQKKRPHRWVFELQKYTLRYSFSRKYSPLMTVPLQWHLFIIGNPPSLLVPPLQQLPLRRYSTTSFLLTWITAGEREQMSLGSNGAITGKWLKTINRFCFVFLKRVTTAISLSISRFSKYANWWLESLRYSRNIFFNKKSQDYFLEVNSIILQKVNCFHFQWIQYLKESTLFLSFCFRKFRIQKCKILFLTFCLLKKRVKGLWGFQP